MKMPKVEAARTVPRVTTASGRSGAPDDPEDQATEDEQDGHLDHHGQADSQEFSAQDGGLGGRGGEQTRQGAFFVFSQDGLRLWKRR